MTSDEVAAMKEKAVKQFPAYTDVINDLSDRQVEEIKRAYPKFDDAVAKANGADLKVVKFVRFETGEGLEKKNEDFAAEVAAQLG